MLVNRNKLEDANDKAKSLLAKYKEIDKMIPQNSQEMFMITEGFGMLVKLLDTKLILSDNQEIEIADEDILEAIADIIKSYDSIVIELDEAVAEYNETKKNEEC